MGGSVTTSGVCKKFSDWFHNNGIHDLQFKSPRFTWSRGSLSKRLDQVVCNKAWFSKYPNASVLHLLKVESDHRPVVVRFDQYGRKSKGLKPFRFMAAWLTDSRFENFMENNWNNDVSYYQAASKFTKQVQQWNKDTFGNILQRKKGLLARIGGVQRALERRPLRSLHRHEISRSIQQGQWKPIRLAKLGIPLSHLFFADDLLLLSEASRQQTEVINKVMEEFCVSSGAKVNKSKTLVYFSKNISAMEVSRISSELGVSVTDNLGKYLGVLLLHNRVSKQTYQNIIDTMDKRLSGWNASHLSLAGRITLAQSVLQAIPVYVMQTINLPRSIKLKIDQLCRRFIWSGSAEHQKMSLVSWDMVCTPKSKGGLGFKKLEIMNHALIMKINWSLITEPTKLSNKVLLTKYGVQMDEVPTSLPTRCGSPLWKAMGNIWEKTRGGIRWNIGDGETVNFWGDCWVTSLKPLAECVIQPIPNELLNKRAMDFLDGAGNWNWPLFSHLVPSNVLLKIAAIHPPTTAFGNDSYFWGIDWRLAWNWKDPQSIPVFLWLILHGRLKTREELNRRHIIVSIYCDRCGGSVEDILHSLRDCVTAKRCVLFNHGSWDSSFIVTDIKARTYEILRKGFDETGAGGLLRDFTGNWIMGFIVNIGMCSVLSAERWGLLHGLRMAWENGFRRVQVGVDNESVVHLLTMASVLENENATLIKAIRKLLE
ncbi:putative ribonuclease H protein [Citrus sinensis]|nr:putative ribonuclease H protein [Citrus sinensis]